MTRQHEVDSGLVYDVGAHLGEDSAFYLKLGYRVVAIEANPELVSRLQQRFAGEIAGGRFTIVPHAIGQADQDIVFFVNRKSIWGTTDPQWAQRNANLGRDSSQITVRCVRFEDLLEQHGCPVYVKIDIEGADMLCVRALGSVSVRPRYVSIESSKTSWRGLLDELNTLQRLGYTRFKVIDQRKHGNGQFRTASGGSVRHDFDAGSSGPFGENLEGPWLSKRQTLLRYIPIFILYKTLGDNTFLSRVLWRFPVLSKMLTWVGWYDTHAMRV